MPCGRNFTSPFKSKATKAKRNFLTATKATKAKRNFPTATKLVSGEDLNPQHFD